MRRLKRKNAELAVIAKRLEERARKLQETNLRVVRMEPEAQGKRGAGVCTLQSRGPGTGGYEGPGEPSEAAEMSGIQQGEEAWQRRFLS